MHHISNQKRIQGAIWGQFIGDASGASYPFSKISNNQSTIQRSYSLESLYLVDPQMGQKRGKLSHYGDGALVLLQSLVQNHGFSPRGFGALFVETFASPDYFKKINRTTQETIKNYHLSLEVGHPDWGYEFQGGASNDDIDNATRFASLISFYFNKPDLLSIVDKATRVTQNHELAVAYMRCYARITRSLLTGSSLLDTFQNECKPDPSDTSLDRHVRERIKNALETDRPSANHFGYSQSLDDVFPSAVFTALHSNESFEQAVFHALHEEGDRCGRASLVGTWLGAALGIEAIPRPLQSNLEHAQIIQQYIHDITLVAC